MSIVSSGRGIEEPKCHGCPDPIHNVPDGYRLSGVEVVGAEQAGVHGDGTLRRVRLSSTTGGEAAWTLAFTR